MDLRRVVGALCISCFAVGCVGTEEKLVQAALAEGCILNSECAAPLVCAFRRCHAQCESNADCTSSGEQLQCVPSDRPYKVCLLKDEASCVYHTDCPLGLRCARDLKCRVECLADADCVTGQVCAQGACAAPSELVSGVLPTVGADGGPGGSTCLYTSDCPSPQVCIQGQCRAECISARDCRADEVCDSGRCVVAPRDGGWGAACVLNSDCPAPLVCGPRNLCAFECVEARDCESGACCFENTCRRGAVCQGELPDGGLVDGGVRDAGTWCLNDLACDDGNFCNGLELCVRNLCQRALHPICDDSNPCTVDMCDATRRTCSYASLGPDAGDLDHDGHPAVQCGGSSDDCDDGNPAVFPGHPEDCDFIDNNCNGVVDEGLWRERPGARISLHGQARFPWFGGPPSVVAIDGGFLIAVSSDTIDGWLEVVRTDDALVHQQGPFPVMSSRTQWVRPPGTTTPLGKHLLLPRLSTGNGQVVASAFVGSLPGQLQCTPGDSWTLELQSAELSPLLGTDGGVRPWAAVATDTTSSSCNIGLSPEWYYPDFGSARLVWSPQAQRWLAAWGVRNSSNSRVVTVANGDGDGGWTGRHELLAGAPQSLQSMYVSYEQYILEPPWVVPAGGRALVAWQSTSPNQPRYVLMDPALNSQVTPIIDVYESVQLVNVGLASGGSRFFLTTQPSSAGPSIRELDLDGGLVAGPWGLPRPLDGPNQTALGNYGADTANRPEVVPFVDGYLALTPSWPDVTFSYLSRRNDGGVVSTVVPMPNVARSQVVLVPLTDTTVGLVWTDGELKRTVVECRP